jgi:hypothetical protein
MGPFSIARLGGTVLNIYFGASWALSFVVAIICNFLSSRLLQYFSTRLTRFHFFNLVVLKSARFVMECKIVVPDRMKSIVV